MNWKGEPYEQNRQKWSTREILGKDHNPKDLIKGISKTCTKVIKIVNYGG